MRRFFSKSSDSSLSREGPPIARDFEKKGIKYDPWECCEAAKSLIESKGESSVSTLIKWISILQKTGFKFTGNAGHSWQAHDEGRLNSFSFEVFSALWQRKFYRAAYRFLSRLPEPDKYHDKDYRDCLECYAREGDLEGFKQVFQSSHYAPFSRECRKNIPLSLNRLFLFCLEEDQKDCLKELVRWMQPNWSSERLKFYGAEEPFPIDPIQTPITLRECRKHKAFADYESLCLKNPGAGEFSDLVSPSSFKGVWEGCQDYAEYKLRIAHSFFFGSFMSKDLEMASRWAKTALEGSLSPDQTLEAELISQNHTNVKAMGNDEVEKERLRLEFEFKKWEKSQELAHEVELAKIEAARDANRAKIAEDGKILALEKEAALRVDEVLETHDKVVGTLQLQVEKNNAEAEKYKALLGLQEQRKDEGKSDLADVLKILEQLKNDG